MKKVGLLGEDPNDTSSIKNLLERKYSGIFKFHVLAKRIKGFQLDNPKIRKVLPLEFEEEKCRFVIYIRDLDGFESEEKKIKAKQTWFKELDALLNGAGIILLNIWELEALVLSDIDTFNNLYGVDHKFTKNPMLVKEPKEYLIALTKKNKKQYKESHCPEIFKKLSIDKVQKKCSYFKSFITELDEKK
jgi:hypothetical protein